MKMVFAISSVIEFLIEKEQRKKQRGLESFYVEVWGRERMPGSDLVLCIAEESKGDMLLFY
jgi:hypothetical protein